MRSRRLRVAHITHTSHHYQNDPVYMGTPRISMVTIPSSIAATAIAYGLDKKSKTESRALLLPFSASPPALSLAHSCIEQCPGLLESLDPMRPRRLAKPEAKSSWLIRLLQGDVDKFQDSEAMRKARAAYEHARVRVAFWAPVFFLSEVFDFVAHIKYQENPQLHAAAEELKKRGVKVGDAVSEALKMMEESELARTVWV
jgi:hypothetical protein